MDEDTELSFHPFTKNVEVLLFKSGTKIHLDVTMNLSAFCDQSRQADVTVASQNTLLARTEWDNIAHQCLTG